VDIGAEYVKADPSKQPQYQKNYEDCPEHSLLLRSIHSIASGMNCDLCRLHPAVFSKVREATVLSRGGINRDTHAR
jgi:hypothetical protein